MLMKQFFDYKVATLNEDAGSMVLQAPDGRMSPKLPGRSLEAAFYDKRDELFFLTHDILHEEQLDICLVRKGVLIDRLSLGQMFQPGLLGQIKQYDNRAFTFEFPKNRRWNLKVAEALQFSAPNFSTEVSRQRMWRSFLKLTLIG